MDYILSMVPSVLFVPIVLQVAYVVLLLCLAGKRGRHAPAGGVAEQMQSHLAYTSARRSERRVVKPAGGRGAVWHRAQRESDLRGTAHAPQAQIA